MLLIAGCGRDSGSSTTSSAPPTDDTPFELLVEPDQHWPIAPGQLVVTLVSPVGGSSPVTISAATTGPATVDPAEIQIEPGAVGEFTLVAEQAAVGSQLTLELTARRGTQTESNSLTIDVVDWPDDLEEFATDLRDRFVSYLEAEHPDLGITTDTEWTPTITKPEILVVKHYLFFSEEWEMGLIWHVTVPEHAWSRMYLRPRDELAPTIGFEIPSYPDPESTPVPWEPEPEIDR